MMADGLARGRRSPNEAADLIAKEPGENTEIGGALKRILTEIAEATLRSVSLETMLKRPT